MLIFVSRSGSSRRLRTSDCVRRRSARGNANGRPPRCPCDHRFRRFAAHVRGRSKSLSTEIERERDGLPGSRRAVKRKSARHCSRVMRDSPRKRDSRHAPRTSVAARKRDSRHAPRTSVAARSETHGTRLEARGRGCSAKCSQETLSRTSRLKNASVVRRAGARDPAVSAHAARFTARAWNRGAPLQRESETYGTRLEPRF
jgi:hypothetical protein